MRKRPQRQYITRGFQMAAVILFIAVVVFLSPKELLTNLLSVNSTIPQVAFTSTSFIQGQPNTLEVIFQPAIEVTAASGSGVELPGYRLASVRQRNVSGTPCVISNAFTSFVCADLGGNNPFDGVLLNFIPTGTVTPQTHTLIITLNVDAADAALPENGLFLSYPNSVSTLSELANRANRVRVNVTQVQPQIQVVTNNAGGNSDGRQREEVSLALGTDRPIIAGAGGGGSGGGGGGGGGSRSTSGGTIKSAAPTLACAFPDIASVEEEMRKAILSLCKRGILKGYPDGTFGPLKNINRAEMSKLLIEGFHKASLSNHIANKPFTDTEASEWYTVYVDTSKKLAVFSGYPDGTFKPANNITWAEVAKVLVTGPKIKSLQSLVEMKKSENPTLEWFAPYVLAIQEYTSQLMPSGTADFSFWEKKVKRGEVALWLSRVLEK